MNNEEQPLLNNNIEPEQPPAYEEVGQSAPIQVPPVRYVHPVIHTATVQLITHPLSNQPIAYELIDGRIFVDSDASLRMFCPHDGHIVETTLGREAGCFAYSMSALLCCVSWPLFWTPFCINRCQERTHVCMECGRTLAYIPN